MTKWGDQRIVLSLLDSPSIPLASPQIWAPTRPELGLRANLESLPGLMGGHSDAPPPPPSPAMNKETLRPRVGPLTLPKTRLHRPEASQSGGNSAQRGRLDLSPRPRTRRLSGAPGPTSDPSPLSPPPRPHSPSFIPLPACPHSAGAQRRLLKPSPSTGTAATANPEAQPNPLFLF